MLGPEPMAGVSLGTLVGNITGMSLMFGMLSGFDTLAPHAMGLNKRRDVGLLAQRGLYLSAISFLPACFPWFYASSILQTIGQPADAADLAADFLIIYCLAVPALLGYEVTPPRRDTIHHIPRQHRDSRAGLVVLGPSEVPGGPERGCAFHLDRRYDWPRGLS